MRFCLSGFFMVVLAFIGLMVSASPGYADIYRWVDENGTVWFSDNPANLPKESHGESKKVMEVEKPPDSKPPEQAPSRPAVKSGAPSPAGAYLENENRRLAKKEKLESAISNLERELAAARRALQRIPLTDRRGYWYRVDPATGKRVQASYKDPGAIWSTQTWQGVPPEARTTESEERKRIGSDIARIEEDLNSARKELRALSQGF